MRYKDLKKHSRIYAPFLVRLRTIYLAIDQSYRAVADSYDFECTGCKDSCCLTQFFHYTLLEYLYIHEGYNTLDYGKQLEIVRRAMDMRADSLSMDRKGTATRRMCPLNFNNLCLLYDYRPMICRLHGIFYELRRPGHNVMFGPGCETFTEQCHEKGYIKFDRTPFYTAMAELENELRQKINIRQKLKLTVARMLIN